MTMSDGLPAWVASVTALTSVLGTGASCQFYPTVITEEKTPPYIIYEETRDTDADRHDAPAMAASATVVFSCVGDAVTAPALADALYIALMHPRFTGLMGPVWVQTVHYKGSSPAYRWEQQDFAVDATYEFVFNL